MANSHLQGSPSAPNADDSRRLEHDADSKIHDCENEPNRSSIQRCGDALTIRDVIPIEDARERFLYIVANNFTMQRMVDLTGSEDDCTAQYEQDNLRKRKSRGVRYEGDSQYVNPLKYVENIYETLVNEVNARLASLDGSLETTIGVDLEGAGGLYRRLARKFPEQGPCTFGRKEVTTLFEARKWFPGLVLQEEEEVHFVVVNGLDIVEKPDTFSDADAEWFKRLTGRSEVSVSAKDYMLGSPRHKYQHVVSNPLSHTGTNDSPVANPLVLCSIAEKKKLSSSKGNSPPKTPHAQPPLGSSLPQVSCSSKSMESKADVKLIHVDYPYMFEVPTFMVPYIHGFHDDFAFGHNGFQVIAEEVDLCGEGGWCGVRRDLFSEFMYNREVYAPVFTSETVKRILKVLAVWTIPATLPEQQFSAPDMGYLVATQYQVVFVVLGQQTQQCVTFLPLYKKFDSAYPLNIQEICLVYLHHRKRFISVGLDEGFESPLPPIHPLWHRHHDISVDGLEHRYADRIRDFQWFQSFMDPPPSVEKCD